MNFINQARREKGYTQIEMAKKMNMSKGGYTKLEYGINKLTLARFIEICKVLDLDLATTIKAVAEDE